MLYNTIFFQSVISWRSFFVNSQNSHILFFSSYAYNLTYRQNKRRGGLYIGLNGILKHLKTKIMSKIKAIIDNLYQVSNEHRKAMDGKPDVYERYFTTDPPQYEKQVQEANEYVTAVKNQTAGKLSNVYKSIRDGKQSSQEALRKAKYPLDSMYSSEYKTRSLMTKQRAEQLALQPDLNWNLVKIIDKEIQNKDTDFLMHFKDAIEVNENIQPDLREEIFRKISDFEEKTGITKIQNEALAFDKLEEVGNVYKEMLHDEKDPLWKFQGGHIVSEIERLTAETNETKTGNL